MKKVIFLSHRIEPQLNIIFIMFDIHINLD